MALFFLKLPNEHLCIKETCIYVEDLDPTKDFYSGKIGLPLISSVKNRHVFFRLGNAVLLCFIDEETRKEKQLPPHGAYGVIHFAFEVSKEEYSIALQKIENSGIEILHEHSWKTTFGHFTFQTPMNILLK